MLSSKVKHGHEFNRKLDFNALMDLVLKLRCEVMCNVAISDKENDRATWTKHKMQEVLFTKPFYIQMIENPFC